MNIWPLGTGGWMPAHGRHTSATLIEHRDRLIIVDAGTGLCRLQAHSRVLDMYEQVDLVLTHYHLDHLMGLFFLPKFLKEKQLTIWGPGAPHYTESCAQTVQRHLSQPFGTTGAETLAVSVAFRDYNEDGFSIGGIEVDCKLQIHTLPSFGLTFDGLLHIASDTKVDKSVFEMDVELILHECWGRTDEDVSEHSSMEALKAAWVNRAAGGRLKSVGLIHRNPDIPDAVYASWTKPPFFVVQDNMPIILKK